MIQPNSLALLHQPRRLLIQCIVFSLVVHVAAVAFLYFYPLVLQGPLRSLFGMTTATPSSLEADAEEEFDKKNQELEEAFEKVLVLSPHFQQPYDLSELPKGIALAPSKEEVLEAVPVDYSLPDLISAKRDFAVGDAKQFRDFEEKSIAANFLSQEMGMPIASQLQIDSKPSVSEIPHVEVPVFLGSEDDLIAISDVFLRATFETDYSLNVSPKGLKTGEDLKLKADLNSQIAQVTAQDLKLENEKIRSTLFVPKGASSHMETREIPVASAISELEQYELPAIAMASEWNSDFDVNVSFLPDPEGQGYIFSVSLEPSCDFTSHSLRQNLYFILDRSNSVQKHRFAVFKRAVLKALASIQQGDTFNIFVMDKKLTSFRPQNCTATLKNIQAAEEFLDKQEAGGLFAAGEIYHSLDNILTHIPDNEEMHTAILLTDGKSSLNPDRKQSTLKKWVEKNNGKLSLYAAAVGRDNDLISLDMLCSISGGKLLYSDTHASLPRKLAKLVIDLKDPIAKDILISAIPHNPHSHIEFYPASSHLPALFSHQPFVLYGKIDDPCAFDLVIQGRHRDQWIAIKKNVSFIEGHKGDQALQSEWSAQHANVCYSKFLQEGKMAHLHAAKEILKKARSTIAYE